MKPKLTLLIIIGLAFLGFGLIKTTSKIGQDQDRPPAQNRLHWHIEQAKAQGKSKISVPGPIIEYAGVNMGLEEALQHYSIVIAEPVGSKSYVIDGNNVRTWHKFKVTEVLAEKPPLTCDTCGSPPTIPVEMLPINDQEFVLPAAGGTVVVDGVELTESNYLLPPFELGKRFVFFLSISPSRLGQLAGGPSGVFMVDENGLLKSKSNQPLRNEILSRFDAKLSRFKSHIKR